MTDVAALARGLTAAQIKCVSHMDAQAWATGGKIGARFAASGHWVANALKDMRGGLWERGFNGGCLIYRLTPLGRQVRALLNPPEETTR